MISDLAGYAAAAEMRCAEAEVEPLASRAWYWAHKWDSSVLDWVPRFVGGRWIPRDWDETNFLLPQPGEAGMTGCLACEQLLPLAGDPEREYRCKEWGGE